MKRLCFVAPDTVSARKVVADLQVNGVPEEKIYVVAHEGVDLTGMPDAGPEADDFLANYKRGLELGGAAGLAAGLLALAFPPLRLVVGGGLVILIGLWGAGLGGMLSGIAGASYSSSRLREFEEALEQGGILVLADVPKDQVEHFEHLVILADPDVQVAGIEPRSTLWPRSHASTDTRETH